MFGTNVYADYDGYKIYTEVTLNYIIKDGIAVIVNYFGTDSEVKVPDHVGAYSVRAVAKDAFTKDHITKVILPETVSIIEEGAFKEDVNVAVYDSFDNNVEEIQDKPIEEYVESITQDSTYYYDEVKDDSDIEVAGKDLVDESEKIIIEEGHEEDYLEEDTIETNTKNNNYSLYVCIGLLGLLGLFLLYKKK